MISGNLYKVLSLTAFLQWLFTCSDAFTWSGALKKVLRVSSLYMMIEGVVHSIFLSAPVNTTEQPEIRAATVQSIDMAVSMN